MKILVADDHALVREGLKNTLQNLTENPEIFQAENGAQVLALVNEHPDLDLVLLDLYMPETDGFELLTSVCNDYPDLAVVILSASDEPENMRRSLDRGASGFIPKSTPHEVMLSALRLIISGGVYIPPGMLAKADSKATASKASESKSAVEPIHLHTITGDLTERQQEVLALMGRGYQNKVIAKKLGLSEHTVKIHVTAILKALGVSNRTQAVLVAQQLNYPTK